jgi:hypothetical protein
MCDADEAGVCTLFIRGSQEVSVGCYLTLSSSAVFTRNYNC